MHDKKTLRLVQVSLLVAIIVVLQTVSYILSKFAILPVSISLVFIPIVIGGFALGIKYGAILGFSFGTITFIGCVTGIDAGGQMLFAANPFITFLLCILKATVAATVSALLYKILSKVNSHIRVAISSAVAPVINTGIFLLAMFTIYRDTLYSWAGGKDILTYTITGLVGVNFLIEFISTVVLSPIVFPNVKKSLISE